ncbi:MAG: Peptidase family M50 [Candidatus Methanofastidiosum methylothiophilum]|uniref:Peptidase family M50 n=1 Tax=Candidatus Methanofastidiosum methylothiophilum TaxID=1705564 RepID=A0A150IRB8_9EURY|nr:MAG: Peptidase family M50 [Candidatus Methanofastidiosum methylthiophilus]KYC47516.1 MAG: Peptidase family M50 [Candidatus Methanofastidiosum methylthiophilus]KYC50416.1 MAG: Peptidase family M50 [Candidatus Methanofastidiosum methylthiophilus]
MVKVLECEKCGYKEYLFSEQKDYDRCPSCKSLVIGQEKNELPEQLQEIINIANENFSYGNVKTDNYSALFEVRELFKKPEEIISSFEKINFYPFIRKEEGKLYVLLRSSSPKKDFNYKKNLILFILTVISTTIAGYFMSVPHVEYGFMANPWVGAIAFSFSIMVILGTHEMGHYLVARKNGVDATLPYFIPAPFILGTMGAVINIRSFIPTKNSAIELGLSGPLAGILVAIPITIVGVVMSPVVPTTIFEGSSIYLGEPLIFKFIAKSIVTVTEGNSLYLHPVAFAGWAGIFVTMLNLIPMGQLDGGHIARAVLGPINHRYLSFIVAILLFGMGLLTWAGWSLWGVIGFYLAYRGHPGSMDEITPIEGNHWIMVGLAIVLFVMSTMIVPIKIA